MENPIKYTDLFEETGIDSGIAKLLEQIKSIKEGMTTALNEISTAANGLQKDLGNTSSATEQGVAATKKLATSAEDLYVSYIHLSEEEKELTRMANEVITAQKGQEKVSRLLMQIATEQNGSYNRLAATYKLLTTAIDSLSESELKNEQVGGRMIKSAAAIRDQMVAMKKQVRDTTLSVGNYEESFTKALNGLSLSTIQVARELPSLGNSVSQFFMAISNNVPIFVDNLKRAAAEMGGIGAALKGIMTPWFGLQLLIVGLTTALPILTKKLEKKRKEQEKDTEAVKEDLKYTELYAKALRDTDKAIAQDITKLETYYYVSQDLLRSMDDRLAAAAKLKEMYKEEFENFTTEEIALGKAKAAYDDLTNSLVQNATARAYMNKITSLKEQQIDQQAIADRKKAELDLADAALARAKAEMEAAEASATAYDSQWLETLQDNLNKATQAQVDAKAAWMEADRPIQELDNTIETLRKHIPVGGINEIITGGRGKGGKPIDAKAYDYYWQWRQGIIDMMNESYEKEREQINLNYDKQIDDFTKVLEKRTELQKLANEEQDAEKRKAYLQEIENINSQEGYITQIIANLRQERTTQLIALDIKYNEKTRKMGEQTAEERVKIEKQAQEDFNKTNEEMLKDDIAALDTRYNTEASALNALYGNRVINRRKQIALEKKYWEEMILVLATNGALTIEKYNEIFAHIEELSEEKRRTVPRSFIELVSMLAPSEKWSREFMSGIENAFGTALDYSDQWLDRLQEIADAAVESAKVQTDAAKKALDTEMEARANGYANSIEYARLEYEERLKIQQKAQKEADRIAKIQQDIDSAQQASSLLVATANMWAAYTKGNVFGAALAAAATAAMWASFVASKAQAKKVTKYGDGMSEYLDYGGSHASGHDIDFGVTKDGTRRRVERGEMIGVINKRNVSKYGVSEISSIIDSLNHGTFEEKYGLAFAGMALSQGADLTKLENGVNTLVEQGSRRTEITPWGRIEYNGNTKRIIKCS